MRAAIARERPLRRLLRLRFSLGKAQAETPLRMPAPLRCHDYVNLTLSSYYWHAQRVDTDNNPGLYDVGRVRVGWNVYFPVRRGSVSR